MTLAKRDGKVIHICSGETDPNPRLEFRKDKKGAEWRWWHYIGEGIWLPDPNGCPACREPLPILHP